MKVALNIAQKLLSYNCTNKHNLSFARNKKAIYAIDYDGNYEKIESISDIKDVPPSVISSVLSERCAIKDNKTLYLCAHSKTTKWKNKHKCNISGTFALSKCTKSTNLYY